MFHRCCSDDFMKIYHSKVAIMLIDDMIATTANEAGSIVDSLLRSGKLPVANNMSPSNLLRAQSRSSKQPAFSRQSSQRTVSFTLELTSLNY